jgi:hypothetical protein
VSPESCSDGGRYDKFDEEILQLEGISGGRRKGETKRELQAIYSGVYVEEGLGFLGRGAIGWPRRAPCWRRSLAWGGKRV